MLYSQILQVLILNFDILVDLTDPVYAKMHSNRFKTRVAPKLIKSCAQNNIFGDVFPEPIEPKLNLEINFQNTNWLGAYGHPVPPNWALYSPRFAISSNQDKLRYFTLMMTDIGNIFHSYR